MTIIATKPKLVLRLKDPRRFQRAWLSDEEYEFLLWDIENAIIEGNQKYGYGGGLPMVGIHLIRREAKE